MACCATATTIRTLVRQKELQRLFSNLELLVRCADYFTGLLWHNLMGNVAINVSIDVKDYLPPANLTLRVYA